MVTAVRIFSSSLTPGRVNPISKLTVVLIWKTPAYLKFGKISNRAEENLNKENSESELRTIPNFLVFLFELFVAKCILVNSGAVYSR